MIVKSLVVKGEGKEDAVIEFSKGLNVIAGASDTGKSYITECFQFILGAKKSPKSIEQSKGYGHLYVEFEREDGTIFVLSRELNDKSDLVLNELGTNSEVVIKPGHTGKKNLSRFFLKESGVEDKVLVKGVESLNHAALTLRMFEKIFIVDERRIISEKSPIGTGQNNEATLETSLLKTILTGEDDSRVLELKKDKESKGKNDREFDSLNSFLEKFFPENNNSFDINKLDSDLEALESSYEVAEKELSLLVGKSNDLLIKRDSEKRKMIDLEVVITEDQILRDRFIHLKSKYYSDRERLEANTEALATFDQYELVNCPVCDGEIEGDECKYDFEKVVKANFSDIARIDTHLSGLEEALTSVLEAIEKNLSLVQVVSDEVAALDQILNLTIGRKIQQNKELLRDLNSTKAEFRNKRDFLQKRNEILEEIERLRGEVSTVEGKYVIADFEKESKSLSLIISEIMERWGFPEGENSKFDLEQRDVVIGGKPRSYFGKGYRAICFSALIMAMMEYLVPKSRHPGFVLLDSPLTTYKKQDDVSIEGESEEVMISNNMIYSFYRDLCDSYSDKQVIVLDNQEPDEDLIHRMKYTHFSGNKSVGRYGFFPSK